MLQAFGNVYNLIYKFILLPSLLLFVKHPKVQLITNQTVRLQCDSVYDYQFMISGIFKRSIDYNNNVWTGQLILSAQLCYKDYMFKYLLVFVLLQLTFSYLKVYGPPCAATRVPDNIEYTLSNFGEILYGQTILGQIRVPNDPLLCKIEGETYKKKDKQSNTKDILLVQRGTCKFTEKVINAQNLGADLIIIYDNNESTSPNVIMKNDGHGHLAQIPSLFISKTDGLNLLATSQSCPQLPIVKIEFEIDQKQKSQVTLWLDASNRETFILARDFYKNDYYQVIQDHIDLNVRFRIEGSCDDWICFKDDCLYASLLEKYCRNVVKTDSATAHQLKGVDIIYEQLREYFLWEQLKGTNQKLKWWRYMTKFDHQVCIQKVDIADCSYEAMTDSQISETIINSVKAKVQATVNDLKDGKDNIIKQSYQESKEMGVFFYPEATINNRNFYGLFKAPEVFETICNSLINPPSQCINFIKQNHTISVQEEDSGIKTAIVVILCLMTLGFLVALFIYTRIIRKQVNQQLSVQVNKMVESYVDMANRKNSGASYNKI